MVSPIASVRKDTIVVVSKTRETEVNEMGEGSLKQAHSTVRTVGNQLHESHQVGKGFALLRNCISETLNVPETLEECKL